MRALSALLSVILVSPALGATPSVVQVKTDSQSTSATFTTITLNSAVTDGNALVILHSQSTTDAPANAYTVSHTINGGSANNWPGGQVSSVYTAGLYSIACGYYFNVSGGTCVVTIDRTQSGTEEWRTVVLEVENVDAIDQAFNAETTASSTTHNLWSPAVNLASDSIAFAVSVNAGSATVTQPAGWTLGSTSLGSAGHAQAWSPGYPSGQTSYSGGMSASDSEVWDSIAFSLKSTGGGGVAVDPLSKTITGSPTAINPIPSGF